MPQILSTNTFTTAKWIVSATSSDGTHTTIASALTSASSGDTIFIRPGTYTENLTLKAGVNLTAFECDAQTPNVTIIGKMTATFTGTVTISGIKLTTNSDYFLECTGATTFTLNLFRCFLNCSNNTGINITNSSAGSNVICVNCYGDIGTTGITYYTVTNNCFLKFEYCTLDNSGQSTTASNNSTTNIIFKWTSYSFPISTSSTGTIQMTMCNSNTGFNNAVAILYNGTGGGGFVTGSYFNSGTASTISVGAGATLDVHNCVISSSNTNAITGAGTLIYTVNSFYGSSSTVNTTTQTVLTIGPRLKIGNGAQIISGSGSPSGSITAPKGSLYLRTDGSSTSTRAYINTNSGTTWTAITTVA